jgi:hypothetical protein
MKNPATNPEAGGFNVFTRYLKEQIDAGFWPLVRLRDGREFYVEWYTEEGPEYEQFYFRNRDVYLIWNNDGTSITNRDFDMMSVRD